MTAANTTQRYLMVSYPQKVDALTRILEVENFEAMIVFVRTKQATEELAEKLRARGFSAAAINGDVVQPQRERTIDQLKSGKLDILVATDVAARGLDVDRISHVVNYDIPTDTESYVHRIGRTGRAGRNGDAISFVTPRERHLLELIEKATRQPLTQMHLPSVEDVNVTRLARFDDAITEALGCRGGRRLPRRRRALRRASTTYPRSTSPPRWPSSLQGDTPLLLEPEPRASGPRRARVRRPRSPRRDRGAPRRAVTRPSWLRCPMATYRIAVGKRHKVEPRQIVGALANEGGLRRGDFGKIQIRPDFSLVELPADLSDEVYRNLRGTRISGKLIELAPDRGPGVRSSSSRSDGPSSHSKKPRHKYPRD